VAAKISIYLNILQSKKSRTAFSIRQPGYLVKTRSFPSLLCNRFGFSYFTASKAFFILRYQENESQTGVMIITNGTIPSKAARLV